MTAAPMPAATKLDPAIVHIRWCVRRDMEEVLQIEDACYADPWNDSDFAQYLRERAVICLVAECREKIIGYTVYRLHRDHIQVINLAVHPHLQRAGVGTLLFQKLRTKVGTAPGKRRRLEFVVPDTNTAGHLFLKSCGAKAVEILQGESPSGGDYYRFVYAP